MDVTQYSVSALIIQIIFQFTHSAMEEVRFARATDFDVELPWYVQEDSEKVHG